MAPVVERHPSPRVRRRRVAAAPATPVRVTTYSDARARLATLWDQVAADRRLVVLTREGHENMALLPAEELRRLQQAAAVQR